jgi:hypothetical protein
MASLGRALAVALQSLRGTSAGTFAGPSHQEWAEMTAVGGVAGSMAMAMGNQDDVQEHQLVPGQGTLREVYRDAQVRIVADETVTQVKAKALAARVEKAWRSDAGQQQFEDQGALRAPLTVEVLSKAAYTRFTGDPTGAVAGVTTGPNVFVMPDRVLGQANAQDSDTIAHELSHVQDFREAGAQMDQVPTYLEEGKAYVLGDAYGKDTKHLTNIAQVMGQLDAPAVKEILTHFTKGQDEQRDPRFVFLGEVTGALFVEYLSTHVKPDTIARLADAVEATGHGGSFGTTFAKAFGMTLSQAVQRFVDFIQATEGQPAERLKGTLYESALK